MITDTLEDDYSIAILRLSIQIGLNGLSFSELDTLSNQIVVHKKYRFESSITQAEQLLNKVQEIFPLKNTNKQYRDVQIIHNNELNAFIPEVFFNKNQASDYLKFSSKILDNDSIESDLVHNTQMINLYVPYANINNHFIDIFGKFEYKHQASILVERLLKQPNDSSQPIMYANLDEGQLQLVVVHRKRLVLYNHFSQKTPEDVVYYILFVMEQLMLDPERLQLYLLGDVSEEDANYKLIYNYVRHVTFLVPLTAVKLAENIPRFAPHNNFTLFQSY